MTSSVGEMNVIRKVLFVSSHHLIIVDPLVVAFMSTDRLQILCLEGSREKRSFSVKAGLHDLEKLKLFKNHFYPTDEEVNKVKQGKTWFLSMMSST